MKKLRIWATVALTLGILAFILLFLMVLALTDIYHGEENLKAEWGVMQLGFFVIFVLIVATLISTSLVLKYFRDKGGRKEPGGG
jgi:predicted membrane channel-forming protein YqfA (hemolysin III family)